MPSIVFEQQDDGVAVVNDEDDAACGRRPSDFECPLSLDQQRLASFDSQVIECDVVHIERLEMCRKFER